MAVCSQDSWTIPPQTVGYVAPTFAEKLEQIKQVKEAINKAGWIPGSHVEKQIHWFYYELGIDDVYFEIERANVIANNITSLYAAKVAAHSKDAANSGEHNLPEIIRLDMEASDHAIYIDTSDPGKSTTEGPHYESRLEAKYLHGGDANKRFRVESFRSPGGRLRCYFVYQCRFVNVDVHPKETKLSVIGDIMFLKKATLNTKNIYQEVIELAVGRTGPVIKMFHVERSKEKRLVVAFRSRAVSGMFSALSDLYHSYGVTSSRKYVEQFSNGITVINMFLRPATNLDADFRKLEQTIYQITKDISLLYCVPQYKLQSLFDSRKLSLQEAIYGHCVWVFIYQCLSRFGPEYASLFEALGSRNNTYAEVWSKRRLRAETLTSDYICIIISSYPELVRALYASFANIHLPVDPDARRHSNTSDSQLQEKIALNVSNEYEKVVMEAFLVFNNAVLKTNYFTSTKVALSFRLDRSFLPEIAYPRPLFGIFLVIGSEFRGFHLRFRDISRGGIRIVKSQTDEAYSLNARKLFDENYNLANKQQHKNKDIPEGGSKGIILLDAKQQDKTREAFMKYIDSILDLLLPARTPGIENPIVDLYGKEEILFMGSEESTNDLVDWATKHACARGAPWWRSFFTGKSPKLGGIPHDYYYYTTLSVREYAEGIYRKLNLNPSTIKKMQTGGPDGDLGSNEILLSSEKYTAIIDKSGVLVDPNGINKQELIRLAKMRLKISYFDVSKLSKDGYRVLCDDSNVILPTYEVITNGTAFRNTYHLRNAGLTDCFVPCGGPPESVDLTTVSKLIKDDRSTISYLIEGVNLFITQKARLRLESAGCIVIKDASANKGGVMSNSLEVLASLSFDDDGFLKNMCVDEQTGEAPQFYKEYAKAVQKIICETARLEFEAIWREHEQTSTPRSVLSDSLSVAITTLDEELQQSELWQNEQIRRGVLAEALPKLLIDKLGLNTIIQRVPNTYLRSIFGSYLASRFVYQYGSAPSRLEFYDFMSKKMDSIDAGKKSIEL